MKFDLTIFSKFSKLGWKSEYQQGFVHHGPFHLVLESASIHLSSDCYQRKEKPFDGNSNHFSWNQNWFGTKLVKSLWKID